MTPSNQTVIRSRSNNLRIRPGSRADERLADAMIRDRWTCYECQLVEPTVRDQAIVDDELVGTTMHAVGRLQTQNPEPGATSRQLAATDLVADDGGTRIISAGLWLDPRLEPRLPRRSFEKLVARTGPVSAAIAARQKGLDGYLVAVAARHLPEYRPALDLPGYLQQVDAGSIADPALTAHLRYGAHPIGVIDNERPIVVLRWDRS